MKTVGVLALQGDFNAHSKAVERAGGHPVEVRTAKDLDACNGLIVPGGESTTMLKLLEIENLTEPLRQFAARKPIFGTLRRRDPIGAFSDRPCSGQAST